MDDAENRPETGDLPAVTGEQQIERDGSTGRFKPGNRSGGRRPMPPEVRAILEAADEEAARVLVDGLKATKPDAYGEEKPDFKTRHLYASTIHDRLHGKPVQALEGGDGGTISLGVILLPAEQAGEDPE